MIFSWPVQPWIPRLDGSDDVHDSDNRGKRQPVALRSKAANQPGRCRRNKRAMPKFLAFENVAQVDLDNGNGECAQGIQNRDGGVGIGGRIENERQGGVARLLNPADQLAFVVGLAEIDLARPAVQPAGRSLQLDIRKRSLP